MKTPSPQNEAPSAHEQIAGLAYHLWEQAGRPDGRDVEFWTQAESQAKQARASTTATPDSVAPTEMAVASQWKPSAQRKSNPANPGGRLAGNRNTPPAKRALAESMARLR